MAVPHLSLRGKLVLLVLGVSGLVLLLTLASIFLLEERAVVQAREREAQTLAKAVAVSSSAALLFSDPKGLADSLVVAQADPNLLGAMIIDGQGGIAATVGAPQVVDEQAGPGAHWDEEGWLTVIQPIESERQVIGRVQLRSDRGDVAMRLKEFGYWLGIILAAGVIVALLMASLMQRFISRPIEALSGVIARVTHHGDYSVRAVVSTHDEIGKLVTGFNAMLGEIADRDQELRDARANLEVKVAERTQELRNEIVVRQKAEVALRIEEEQLKTLIRYAPVALAMLDTEFKFVEYSQRWPIDLGLSDFSIHQQPFRQVMPWVPDRWLVAIESALAGQVVAIAEDRVPFKSGDEHVLRWSVQPWRRPDGRIGGVLLTAILIDELVRGREEALRIAKTRTEFLANMSHELRTPLNGIIGFTELLLEDKITEQQAEQLQIIRGSGRHLLGLINEVLDFSKLDSGRLELENIPVALREISKQVVAALQSNAQVKGIELRGSIDDSVPPYVMGDSTRLKQIMLNIIGNAIKFTSEGSVSLRISWNPSTSHCTMLFEDTGCGIPEDKLGTIFEAFVQADTSTSRQFGGTGLGLSICKRLVELMKGTVSVESSQGKGTTFRVEFLAPLAVDAAKSSAQSTVASQRFTGRVLVAEDNTVNQKLITSVLGRAGCEVVVAADGVEAVQQCVKGNFDLVLMDIQMPHMNGLEATEALRSRHRNTVPIVALSAHAFPEDEARCLDAGMNGFLTKPINRKRLFEVLATYLRTVEPSP